jgi:hypothetical protein
MREHRTAGCKSGCNNPALPTLQVVSLSTLMVLRLRLVHAIYRTRNRIGENKWPREHDFPSYTGLIDRAFKST